MNRFAAAALVVASCMTLTGCPLPIDHEPDQPWVLNESSHEVVVTVVGTEMRSEMSPLSSDFLPRLEHCEGSRILVEVGGHVASFGQGLCPTSFLRIWASGRITLAGDGETFEATVPLGTDRPSS